MPFKGYRGWVTAIFFDEASATGGRRARPGYLSSDETSAEAEAEIMLGALDEVPSDLKPTREVWIIRRERWLAPIAGAGPNAIQAGAVPALTVRGRGGMVRAT